ncbi:hypothetical protein V1358_10280 [Pseudoalteromonas sp. YIC-656]|uniref:hypothetical protein n=1 Tax=Pseudoalteromonas pernae TaxID=3118054 RepID=UPI003241D471
MIDKALNYIASGQYWLASIVVVFAIIVNIEKIISVIDTQKKKRLAFLKDAISDDCLSDNLKSHLEDELQSEYFYQTHKIRIDKFKRNLLFEYHDKLRGEITFKQFKRANDQLVVKDGKLRVEISAFDNIAFYYNMFFGVIVSIFGFVVFSIPLNLGGTSLYSLINWIAVSAFFIGFGFFMVYQTIPILIAKRIRKAVNTSQEEI